jgi:ABC-type bacteriocin/lantibiotic exporter with double-glycine peptidase domain
MVTFSILRTCISFYFDFDTFIFLYGGIKVVSDYLNSLPKATKVARTRAAPNLFHSGGIDISIENIVYKPPLPNLKGDSPIQSDPSRPLFDGLTMHIRKGEHVAITGRIGSGKSTLAYLLLKMQHISGGSIKLDGININDIDASSVRKAIHYIPQNPRLFNRTLWDNISYGNPSLQPNQVYSMLRELNMLRLESLFRNKMYEYVGKHGYKLSGGQRQMVFLIRLLFNTDAKVLILDEPTSALDQESRDQILRLIKVASRNRTLIVITHDPEILKHTHTTFNIIDGQAVTN